ncbi:MAG TPA: HIT family protein [Mycoplasmatales bacterium]|jgi:histidine triad (HIT) family protein|nr:HIT family protein [Mycoplasmatales bacterium]
MVNCIFCEISEKIIPIEIVFENKNIISFYDINPISKGHMLIITKKHYNDLTLIDDKSWMDIFPILIKSFEILNEKFKPNGFNFVSNIGEEAFQTIKHLHIHLIPKYEKEEGFVFQIHKSESNR